MKHMKKMRNALSLALVSALTVACLTSCTIHIKLDDKDTSSDTSDYSFDFNDSSDTSSSYGTKADAASIEYKESTEENPLKVGEWGQVFTYLSDEQSLGVSAAGLIRGEEAYKMLLAAGYSEDNLAENLKEGDEWAIIQYQVYCPEDYTIDSSLGLYYTAVLVQPVYYSGQYKYTCFGTDISQYDADDYQAKYIQNGEIGNGLYAFSIAKDVAEVHVRFGSDPDTNNDTDEGYAYFLIN